MKIYILHSSSMSKTIEGDYNGHSTSSIDGVYTTEEKALKKLKYYEKNLGSDYYHNVSYDVTEMEIEE